MYSEIVLVTPELAKQFLAKSAGNPRFNNQNKVNNVVVSKYASDMKNGRWILTPQGISFNEDGKMEDGHHRCHAIIRANVPVRMYVTYGVPKHVIYDAGYSRTPQQIIQHTFGVDKSVASAQMISIAKLHLYFQLGESRTALESKTITDIYNFIVLHQDTIKKAKSLSENRKGGKAIIKNAPYGHAIFCALNCGVSYDTLLEFTHIVQSGFCDNEIKYAAIIARNELIQGWKSGDIAIRAYKSKFLQMCINDFSKGIRRIKRYNNPVALYTNMMIESEKLCQE